MRPELLFQAAARIQELQDLAAEMGRVLPRFRELPDEYARALIVFVRLVEGIGRRLIDEPQRLLELLPHEAVSTSVEEKAKPKNRRHKKRRRR